MSRIKITATARKWHQNVTIEGLDMTFEDPNREGSKFWNEGKWNNFIKPLLPKNRDTFVEIGCNAGLFLKMAADAGFRNVIGVEAKPQIMDQAKCFRKYNRDTYKLLQRRVGEDFVVDQLPLADVVLLANVHYYFSAPVFSKLVDDLRNQTLYCLVVSAKKRKRPGYVLYDLDSVRDYFRGWREMKVISGIETENDPCPRSRMYSVLFKSGSFSESRGGH